MLPSTLNYLYSVKPVRKHFPTKQLSANATECSAAWVNCCCGVLWANFECFQWDKCGKCIYIICVIIYDAFTCELPFCTGEYFPGSVYCVFVTSLRFQYLCSGWLCAFQDFFSWISCSKFISHFVESCLIFLIAPLLFTQNMKPYFSEGMVFFLVFFLLCLPSCRTSYWVLFATFFF